MAGDARFVGTWRLVSWELHDATGAVRYPLGRDALGQLTYMADGRMAVQIMRRDRPAFAAGEARGGTPDEIAAAFHGYIAYCGAYDVDQTAQAVTHYPECSLFPNWVGAAQRRLYTQDGNRMTFRSPPIPGARAERMVRIVWERMA